MRSYRSTYLAVATVLVACPTVASADCTAFARYGIYDTRHSASDTERAEAFRTWFCQQNFQTEGSARSAGASLGFGDLTSELSLGWSSSRSSWSEFKSSYCNESTYSSSMRSTTEEFVRSVNANTTNAMLACFNRAGLHARIEQGSRFETFRVYAIFNPSGQTTNSVEVVNFSVDGGACADPLAAGARIGPQGYEMLCTRAGSSAVDVVLNASEALTWDTPSGLRAAVPIPPPERKRRIVIRAVDFVRGQNVAVDQCTSGPGVLLNAQPCHARPNAAEFEFVANIGGTYRLEAEYAAAAPRGVRLLINGELIRDQALATATGGWTNDFLRWTEVGNVQLNRGANVLRIERPDVFPHIRAFRLVPVDE